MRTYVVHVIPKQPACTDRGYEFDIVASTAAEARRRGREQALYEGHYTRIDGALVVTATRLED